MKPVENPQVPQPTFTCSKSIMETPNQCVESVPSSGAYLDPS